MDPTIYPCGPSTPAGVVVAAPFSTNAQTPNSANIAPLVDASPAFIFLTQPPLGGKYWLVSEITALFFNVVTPPQDPPFGPGSRPGCGLFLADIAAASGGESLAEAQLGIKPTVRAIPLDTEISSTLIPASGLYVTSLIWRSGAGPVVVPQGWTIVAILSPNPGTPAPGPGVGSSGTLTALYSVETQR